ncbi:MAG: class I SAM-dependent methyltransferase [Cyanobacteria bacterium REEB67]|nr:class I SAM-dependent methyltransferase [Cyanobacteria bacterium REEB67]
MNFDRTPRQVYWGVFLLSFATLAYEILLTRIFSVTLWYHFAFMVVSIAMFGLTIGAQTVFTRRQSLASPKLFTMLGISSALFGLAIFTSSYLLLDVSEVARMLFPGMPVPATVIACYLITLVPFCLSGFLISALLTFFPLDTPKIYAFDLWGAALGCLLIVGILSLTDALSAVLMIATIAAATSIIFLLTRAAPLDDEAIADTERLALQKKWLPAALTLTALLAAGTIVQGNQSLAALHPLKLTWVKFSREPKPLFEKWNAFSRITVLGDPTKPWYPFAWGLSPTYKDPEMLERLDLHIDGNARTVMTKLKVPPAELRFPKYDIVNMAHHLRPHSDVCVVGVGSGRDILSALCFQQKSVTGVEVNNVILEALNKNFGDFSGHLDRYPGVRLINSEARSYLAQSGQHFDIIQLSLIDTLAAGAAGAFSLAENSLYTQDGWLVFLHALKPTGILTVTRWYHRDMPAETYRIVSLAHDSLVKIGVKEPRKHILLAKCKRPKLDIDFDVATILVSPQRFDSAQQEQFEKLCSDMQFDLLLDEKKDADPIIAALAEGKENTALDSAPYNVSASTDDSPYFFQMLKLSSIFAPSIWSDKAENHALRQYGNAVAIFSLLVLLLVVSVMTVISIFLPLLLARQNKSEQEAPTTDRKTIALLSIYFLCIGLGYMFLEVAQMSRLIVLLGHPTFGLSVVLFALLISGGAGSYSLNKMSAGKIESTVDERFMLLLAISLLIGLVTAPAMTACQAFDIPLRIVVALALILPLGFCMGMAMPLGLKIASYKDANLIPWLWGINGAASVLGSVLCILVSIWYGLTFSYFLGMTFYVIAFIAVRLALSKGKPLNQ